MESSGSAKSCQYWAKKKMWGKIEASFPFLEAPLPRKLKP